MSEKGESSFGSQMFSGCAAGSAVASAELMQGSP
jgi:hypothetical protein